MIERVVMMNVFRKSIFYIILYYIMFDRKAFAKEVHKEFKKKVVAKHQFRKIRASKPLESVQLDLADFKNYKNPANKNNRYLIVLIDVYSRKLWVYPSTTKTSSVVANIVEKWINTELQDSKYKLENLTSDNEFDTNVFEELATKHKFKQWFADPHEKFRTGIVERVIRTLRDRIKFYLTENDTLNYIDGLFDIVEEYNYTNHRSIMAIPHIAFKGKKTHPVDKKYIPQLKKGDRVRILLDRKLFRKSDDQTWSSEVYIVVDKDKYRYVLQNPETKKKLSKRLLKRKLFNQKLK